MPWAQPHTVGAGSTGQIEDAHKALDTVGVPPGPLAIRAITAAGMLDRLMWCQCGLPPAKHRPGQETGSDGMVSSVHPRSEP